MAGEKGITSAGLAEKLAPSAGLRNRIVHEYDLLGHSLVLEAVAVGWVKRSEPTGYKVNEGGFGVKTNALIQPT